MGGWLTPGKVVSYYARSLLSLLPMPLTSMLTCTDKSLTAQAWVYCFRISNSRATTPVKLGTKVLRHWLISVNLRVMIPLVCVYAWILICIFFVWQWHKLIVFRQKTGENKLHVWRVFWLIKYIYMSESSTETQVKLGFLHCSLITLDEICKLAYNKL